MLRLVQILLVTCAITFASTLTNSNFGNEPAGAVIGNPAYFDTQSISVTLLPGNQVQVVIDLDYDNGQETTGNGGINSNGAGSQNLTPFNYAGVTLGTGDLFFYDPSAPGFATTQYCGGTSPSNLTSSNCVTAPTNSSLDYAVVLDGGNGLTTGDLYTIGSAPGDVSVQTAYGVLGSGSGDTYRPTTGVLVTTSGSPSSNSGTETICQAGAPGCNTNGGQYSITLDFSPSVGLLSLLESGQIGLEFAAADCGNAVLSGTVPGLTTTPEPGTIGMIAFGLGMLGFGMARRRKS